MNHTSIQSIQLSLVDPEKIKRTCFLITSAETWDQNTPVKNGLFDLHMGTIDRRYVCQTCGQKEWFCPGHMGYIMLCKPCYNPLMLDYVVKVLRSVCSDCSAILIPPSEIKEQSLDWVANEVSSKAAYRFCCVGHPGDVGVIPEDGSAPILGCRAHRSDYTKTDGLHIKGVSYEPRPEDPEEEAEEEGKAKKKRKKRNLATRFVTKEFIITPEKAYKILRKISPEHAKLMGFGDNQHPSWMIWTNFPILPPSERPSIQMNAQRRGEDDLTCAIFAFIKANQELEKKIARGCHSSQLHPHYELLQYRVATYITNDLQKQPSAKQRSGRVSQGIVQKVKGKEGLVRGNLMGKRVDFSGRSVITGDPTLSIGEVGLPMEMAMILTKRIPVTADNIDECWERVMKGPYVYGGANSIIKTIKGREYIVDLKMTRDRGEISLRKGQQIEVHLEDGDYVLFNRQPTLHRLGMMAHRVKVVKTLTLRMNECDTPPYNADFDGDEMNIHAPQSFRTQAELKWLCAISNHLRSPKNGGATIGLVQDALAAGYLLSREETRVNREIFYDAIMSMKHPWSREIPPAEGVDADGRPQWTGRQLLSMAMPQELNLEKGSVRIYSGVLISGTLNKKLLGVGSGSLVHLVVQQLGEDRASDFLDNLHDVCIGYLKHRGFTFGFRDIDVPAKQQQQFLDILNEAQKSVDKYVAGVTDPKTGKPINPKDADTIEANINTKLNQVLSKAGKEVIPSLPRSNLTIMATESESKGKTSNIMQFSGFVGQQNVYGERIPCGMIDRTLPHFKRGDNLGLKSRGFVRHPYVIGLDPQEVFMHAAGGREGLIDTAIKTAKTGYALRQITNALSDIVVDELFTSRNAQGNVVQFMYGGDCIDPVKLITVKLDYASISNDKFNERYRFDEATANANPKIQEEWTRICKDRKFVQRMAMLPEAYLDNFDDDLVKLSVDIDRLILDAQVRFKCGKHAESEVSGRAQRMHPTIIIDRINELIMRVQEVWSFDPSLISERRYATKMLRIVIRSRLASKRITNEFCLSQRALDWLCNRIIEDYSFSIVQPGEAVGILSAQSNGEPQQQMTLNTFHFAGISAANVTLGVPRIKEVIHCTREPKVVNTCIYLNIPFSVGNPEQELKSFALAWTKRGEVLQLLVRDAILGYSIIWDPIVGQSVIEEDQLLEALQSFIFPDYGLGDIFSGHVIRIEFDPVKLAQHGLTFGGVAAIMREAVGDGEMSACTFSDADAPEPVFRIRARYSKRPSDRDDPKTEHAWRRLEQSTMQRFYQQQVENIRLGGLEDVRNVFIKEDKREGVLMLDTDCRDLQQAMAIKDNITDRCECNHPLEVFRTLGVEAARQSIIIEIRKVYRYYGIGVDARHLTLIADAMTYAGGMMSIDRHGINHAEFNTLKKAAFEEIADVLTKAAVSAKCDPLCDNTSRIMIGQEVRVGTGTFDLLLDRKKHETLSKQFHQPKRQHVRLQRRKRAIADRMAAIDRQFGGPPPDKSKKPAIAAAVFDPMSMAEFAGSGFGFSSDEYNPERPFDRMDVNEEEYDPASPHYSPVSPRSPMYSPASPRYSPASPAYSPASPTYTPSSPTYYDPNMPQMNVEAVPVPYDPESVPFWGGDDNADVGF